MSAYLLLFANKGDSGPPPTTIYSGGTVDPQLSSWGISSSADPVLHQTGNTVTAVYPENITELQAIGLGLDGVFNFDTCINLVNLDISSNLLTILEMAVAPSLQFLTVNDNLLTTLYLGDGPSLQFLSFGDNPFLTSFDGESLMGLQSCIASGCSTLSNLSIPSSVLEILNAGACNLLSISAFSPMMTTLVLANNPLNTLNTASMPVLNLTQVNNTDLNAANLDNFLSDRVMSEYPNGFAFLQVNGGAQPTGGITNTDYLTLLAFGWTISLN